MHLERTHSAEVSKKESRGNDEIGQQKRAFHVKRIELFIFFHSDFFLAQRYRFR